MRLVAIVVIAAVAVAGCSDSSGGQVDPLHGVGDLTAAALCGEFTTIRISQESARQNFNVAGIAQAVIDYESLATKARDAKANEFAAVLSKAAQATDVLSKFAGSNTTPPLSEALAKVLRVQLYETTVQLACAERGYVQSNTTTTTR